VETHHEKRVLRLFGIVVVVNFCETLGRGVCESRFGFY